MEEPTPTPPARAGSQRAGLAIVLGCVALAWTTGSAAHGTLEFPASRTYACRFLEMDAPMCRLAWSADPQALYDWMEVNLGDVAGRHREQIPDGTLCGAGRSKYDVFDTPGPWPATPLTPGADGLFPVTLYATAPHAARYFRFYLSREGFDPLTERLDWDDLELVFDSGEVPVQDIVADPHFDFRIPLPAREGRAILYLVWQRSDSPEAFYGCSDVLLGDATARPTDPILPAPPDPTPEPTPPADPTPPTEPVQPTPEPTPEPVEPIPDPDTPTTPPPALPSPGLGDVSAEVEIRDDWGSGACGDVVVTNTGAERVVWEVNVALDGDLTQLWDAEVHASDHPDDPGGALPHPWRFVGVSWNRELDPAASTRFGFCLARSEPASPPSASPDASVSVEVGGDRWWGGFTALLTVRNDAASPLEGWTHTFRSSHAVAGAPWGVEIESTQLDDGFYEHVIRGVDWARAIPAQGAVEVGFNGTQGRAIGDSGPLDEAMLFDGGASCH